METEEADDEAGKSRANTRAMASTLASGVGFAIPSHD